MSLRKCAPYQTSTIKYIVTTEGHFVKNDCTKSIGSFNKPQGDDLGQSVLKMLSSLPRMTVEQGAI